MLKLDEIPYVVFAIFGPLVADGGSFLDKKDAWACVKSMQAKGATHVRVTFSADELWHWDKPQA